MRLFLYSNNISNILRTVLWWCLCSAILQYFSEWCGSKVILETAFGSTIRCMRLQSLLVSGNFLVGNFLENGIAYLVSGDAYYSILVYEANVWCCKLLKVLLMGPDTVVGLTLVCLGIERIIAITWPLRAKTVLTLRNSALLERAVYLSILVMFFPRVAIDCTLVPNYGCCSYRLYAVVHSILHRNIMLDKAIPLFCCVVWHLHVSDRQNIPLYVGEKADFQEREHFCARTFDHFDSSTDWHRAHCCIRSGLHLILDLLSNSR